MCGDPTSDESYTVIARPRSWRSDGATNDAVWVNEDANEIASVSDVVSACGFSVYPEQSVRTVKNLVLGSIAEYLFNTDVISLYDGHRKLERG
jgi:hypothetical protein